MTPGRAAEVRETHIGVVFLLGDRAYKLKKAVTTGFLDFSTPQRRLAACRREVALNRRLAPDVYLGSQPVRLVTRRGPDRPIPWSTSSSCAACPTTGDCPRSSAPASPSRNTCARSPGEGRRLPRRRPTRTGDRVEGGRDALGGRWAANVAEVRAQEQVLAAGTVDAVDRLARRFLAGREELFTGRCADGRVVDGHGDLIADDVFCLDDGPRVLDCLEFDDRLRYVDGLDDVAFLAMDLERLGHPEIAETLARRLRRVLRRPGAARPAPPLRRLPRLRPCQGGMPAPRAG